MDPLVLEDIKQFLIVLILLFGLPFLLLVINCFMNQKDGEDEEKDKNDEGGK